MNRTKLRSMSPKQRDELRMKYIRILSHLYSELRSYAGDDATRESDAAVRKLQRLRKKYSRLCQVMNLIELSIYPESYCDMTKGEIEYKFGIVSPESEYLLGRDEWLENLGMSHSNMVWTADRY